MWVLFTVVIFIIFSSISICMLCLIAISDRVNFILLIGLLLNLPMVNQSDASFAAESG